MIKVKCFYIHTDEDVVSVHLEFWTRSVKDLDEAIDLLLKAKRERLEYDADRLRAGEVCFMCGSEEVVHRVSNEEVREPGAGLCQACIDRHNQEAIERNATRSSGGIN